MHKTLPALGLLSLALLLVPACAPAGSSGSSRNDGAGQRPPEPERWLIEVLDRRAHDTAAYTQGLLWRDGVIYLNPGSAGPRRFTLPVAVATVRLSTRSLQPKLLELAV